MNTTEKIRSLTEKLTPSMIACRRDLHKYAEPGWCEMRTSSLVARRLTELGYDVLTGEQVCKKDARMGVPSEDVLDAHYARALEQGADPEFVTVTKGGMTGVIGILRCGEGPTVALRFDIDALGVNEWEGPDHWPFAEGFSSVNKGVMHACGHDGHTAVGLGVAEVLMELKNCLRGTVKLIFQPAEEGVMGAKSIVENGHLEGVDYCIGNHITPFGPERYDLYAGTSDSLATTKYDVSFTGTSAHAGAAPHLGSNALLAAATAVTNLHAIPRHGEGASRINVGKLIAGSGRNVIADEAFMQIEVRGATTAINQYVSDYALRILENAAAMHGCSCTYQITGAAESMASSPELCKRIREVCCRELDYTCPEEMLRSLGSEDFSYMMNRVQEQGGQAAFIRVCADTAGPGHSRRFDFGEECLAKTVNAFCVIVADLMQ